MIAKLSLNRFFSLAALALAFTLRTAAADPAATSNSAGNSNVPLPFSLGYVFTVSQNMSVTALGQFDVLGNGADGTAKVALFNWDTGAKLAETTLAGSVLEETGFYDTHFVSITPVGLAPGIRYLLATEVAANDFIYGNGIITFDPSVQWSEGRATPVGSPAMPAVADTTSFSIVRTDEASGSYFGPNMKLSPAPMSTPAATSNSAGNNDVALPFSLGHVFTVSQSVNVTALGQFDVLGNGAIGTAKVALFNWDTGAKLAETTLAGSVLEETGFYDTHFANITPVALSPGTRYLLATEVAANDFIYGNGIITFDPAVQWSEGRATPVGSPTMPATADASTFSIVRTDEISGSYFGPNMKLDFPESPSAVSITSPTTRAIFQRNASNAGNIPISGACSGTPDEIQARAVVMAGGGNSGSTTDWQTIAISPAGGVFSGTLANVPAGGWYQLEARSVIGGIPGAAVVMQKVGVGDIYVTCGQSNSANYGQGGYTAGDDRVCARTAVSGTNWILAADPLPIAGGGGGSVWTRLGDMLATAENIPIGFIAVGVGSTEVGQWIPGTSNYNNLLKPAVQSFPSSGFRAVLWHQGESDAIANTSAATYASRLNSVIAQSRTDAGWTLPWYVAEASFHPATTLSQEEPVTAGQRQVVHGDPLVFLGPTTDGFHLEDASGGKLVDTVHFNNAGLLDHAGQWRDILRGTTTLTPRNGNFEDNRTSTLTGLGPLADGASQLVNTTTDTDSPRVLGWRILSASGITAADGANGFHNPAAGTFAGAVDSINGGVLPHMDGKHVAMLDGGSAGNYFLHSTRSLSQANTKYTLTVAIGVRDNPSNFGTARLEITANSVVVASASFNKAALDALKGGDASGTFTDASVSWITGAAVSSNQPLAIRIVKEGGGGTVLDFDKVRLTAAASTDYDLWATANNVTGGENGDDDFDGLTNHAEYAFGTDPKSGASAQPVTGIPAPPTGTFIYTRRTRSLTGLAYSVWYSTDLAGWTEDATAVEGAPTLDGEVEIVPVTLSSGLLIHPKLFIQVRAE